MAKTPPDKSKKPEGQRKRWLIGGAAAAAAASIPLLLRPGEKQPVVIEPASEPPPPAAFLPDVLNLERALPASPSETPPQAQPTALSRERTAIFPPPARRENLPPGIQVTADGEVCNLYVSVREFLNSARPLGNQSEYYDKAPDLWCDLNTDSYQISQDRDGDNNFAPGVNARKLIEDDKCLIKQVNIVFVADKKYPLLSALFAGKSIVYASSDPIEHNKARWAQNPLCGLIRDVQEIDDTLQDNTTHSAHDLTEKMEKIINENLALIESTIGKLGTKLSDDKKDIHTSMKKRGRFAGIKLEALRAFQELSDSIDPLLPKPSTAMSETMDEMVNTTAIRSDPTQYPFPNALTILSKTIDFVTAFSKPKAVESPSKER